MASNIANTTYRLQWWDFTKFDLPEISNGGVRCSFFNTYPPKYKCIHNFRSIR